MSEYERAITLCEIQSQKPLSSHGLLPQFSNDKYRIALLYFKLRTDYICVELESSKLVLHLENLLKLDLPIAKKDEISKILWLINDEKYRLTEAKTKFDGLSQQDKSTLLKIEAAKRPFNVSDALQLYTNIRI
jgi:hypothetical protein